MSLTVPGLPSTVEESLASCPKFRVVLIGNTGVGKSSLVQRIFKVDVNKIDIRHDRPGEAQIESEYTSDENSRLILHDSKGFEAGSVGNWALVEQFLNRRSKMTRRDQIHAIWLCMAAPLEGARLTETGEENLLKLARQLNIPVIVVFTKYDLLIKEQQMNAMKKGKKLSSDRCKKQAQESFEKRTKPLAAKYKVRVSNRQDYHETLQELVDVTLACLDPDGRNAENLSRPNDDATPLALAVAQRVSSRLKIEASIREGFKKYWINLIKSPFFKGNSLKDCAWCIHADIIKVWNVRDPCYVLDSEEFFAEVLILAEPLLPQTVADIQQDDWLSKCANAAGTAMTIAAPFAHVLIAVGASVIAIKFLYSGYKSMALTARYLGAHIIHLTCILHYLFEKVAASKGDTPQDLSKELVMSAVKDYKDTRSYKVCQTLKNTTVGINFEQDIARLLSEYTKSPNGPVDSGGEGQKRHCIVM